MANTEGVIQPETEISNVLVEPIDNQRATIESTIAEEVREETIQDDDISIKENLLNETINNIHTFLFDILAFFSNSQPSLIAEYCQETENVREE
jgi:thymidine kinase